MSGTAGTARRGEELEHALSVLTQHLREVTRHRVGPKEIVVERSVSVYSLRRIHGKQLVQQVTSIGILDVSLQTL